MGKAILRAEIEDNLEPCVEDLKSSGKLDVCWVSIDREEDLLWVEEEEHAKGTSKTKERKALEGLRDVGEGRFMTR